MMFQTFACGKLELKSPVLDPKGPNSFSHSPLVVCIDSGNPCHGPDLNSFSDLSPSSLHLHLGHLADVFDLLKFILP